MSDSSSESRVAIITGAASGIGLALARDLLAKGWRVALLDVSPTGASTTAELGASVMYYHCDVSSWESQAAAFAATFEKWGRIDFTALNAGIDDKDDFFGPTGDENGQPVKPGLKTVAVDLIGVFYGIRLSMHYFRKNESQGGKIVMTSSDAGLYPLVGVPQYTACKHGLVGITRSMAPILKTENITINAVMPAFVPTGLAPPGLVEAWPKENITPMSTVIKCFNMFIDGEMNGQTGECSQETVYLREQPAYANESQRWGREEGGKVWASVYPG